MVEVTVMPAPAQAEAAPVIVIGAPVFVSYYDATNKIVNGIGHILAVNALDHTGISDSGEPSLTIAIPSGTPDARVLSGPRWYEQYSRLTGVKHVSHNSHATGHTVAAWQEIDAPSEAYPTLLDDREAPPPNPTFTREGSTGSLAVSLEQAAAAQSGLAPTMTVVSPLINDPTNLDALEAQQEALAVQQALVSKSIATAKHAKEVAAEEAVSGESRNQGAGLDDTPAPQPTGPAPVTEAPAVETPIAEAPVPQDPAAEDKQPIVEQSS